MPGIYNVLRKVPWRQVIGFGPAIIEAGRELFKSVNTRHPNRHTATLPEDGNLTDLINDVRARLEFIETTSREEASLLSQLTEQVVEITTRMQFLSDRLTVILMLAIGSFIVSIVVLIKEFLR